MTENLSPADIADALKPAPVLDPVTIPVPGTEPKPASATPPAATEQPTKEAPAEAKPKQGEEPAAQDDADDKPEKRSAKGRISELYARAKTAERVVDQKVGEINALRQQLRELQGQQIEPTDYAAQQRRDIQLAVKAERLEQAEQTAIQQDGEARRLRSETFFAKVENARDRMPDIDTAMQDFVRLPLSHTAADIIAESDKAAEIAYFLAKNQQEATRIASLPPSRQAYELARIEARVTPAQPRRTSNAPPPVPTVGASTAPGRPSVNEMSVDEISREIYGR